MNSSLDYLAEEALLGRAELRGPRFLAYCTCSSAILPVMRDPEDLNHLRLLLT